MAPLSGRLYNGYNEVTAEVAPGSSGTVSVTFDIVVPSITAATFDLFRASLAEELGAGPELRIAQAAGIATPPPPAASHMAGYALQLFSATVFGGAVVSDQSRSFDDADCATRQCQSVLATTRGLEVTQVSFSGTLTASGESTATAQVAAYVPTTAIVFSDGWTVSFAGYSDNVLVDEGGLTPVAIPGEFWSELGGAPVG